MKNNGNLSTRKITVQAKYLDSGSRRMTSQFLLSGMWLEDAGFKPGAIVEVVVRNGELILKPLTEGRDMNPPDKMSRRKQLGIEKMTRMAEAIAAGQV
ncbi:SymE family type I addiction module toxin [Pedobacter sp. MR2016-24]|uniref:SymE family type I addiction module toxin n=1 Tax=Pedobacter sp. MR2016-24 TaxID=2994466 RepID=UPI00224709B4|nr:SymE family type I addiction module toxin [Pedobacter sp. MR2016-24]MCX2482422.1 SymE family type I addiction module toxin [Pedobacter sp. MR2016-24]